MYCGSRYHTLRGHQNASEAKEKLESAEAFGRPVFGEKSSGSFLRPHTAFAEKWKYLSKATRRHCEGLGWWCIKNRSAPDALAEPLGG